MIEQLKKLATHPAFIVLFAYSARIAILCHSWRVARPAIKDFLPYGYELGRVASAIAAGNGFSSPLRFFDTGPTAWFTPIYPYLVAGIFRVWGTFSSESKGVIQISNCAFAALTIIPIYAIAQKCFGKTSAVISAWAWTLLPTSLLFPIIWIWDTALAALFMALLFWATLAMRDAKKLTAWAGYSALWAVGVLINPSLLSVFPFLAGWAVWKSRHSVPWTRTVAVTILVFAAAMVPWTVRNYRVFGKFIVLRSNFGLELWLGNNPGVPDTWSPWLHPNDSLEEAEKYKRMGEIAFMAEKQREAIEFMRTHPAETLRLMYRRFINTWVGISDSPADEWAASPWYLRGFIVLNVAFPLLALLGFLFARRSRSEEALPYFIMLMVFPLVFYLTHSSLRYRFPMDPIMMVLAAYGVAYPISLWNERAATRPRAVAAAPPALID
jgi:Dolichyl-phosphate-mannose-protein mannosyltransferase